MNHARGALGVALVLSGIRTAGAEPCVPRAALGGDAAEVARVAAELMRLGVAIDPPSQAEPARCAVTAAVEPDAGGGISVAVRNGSQRSEGRIVSDPTVAAMWIDSWVHDDFETTPAPLAAETPVAAPGTVAALAVTAPRTELDRFTLAASYEQVWTDDHSWWDGFGAGACVRIGAFCFGARVRYASQQVPSNLTIAARSDVSALATASWSHPFGRMEIAPELGLGIGRMTTARIDGCAAPQPLNLPPCQPSDPTCGAPPPPQPCTVSPDGTTTGPVYVGDNFDTSTYTPRGEAALRVSVPLFAHVWLQGLASVTLAPFGHSGSYQPAPAPTAGTTAIMPAQIALPGEPSTAIQLGIGLVLGAP